MTQGPAIMNGRPPPARCAYSDRSARRLCPPKWLVRALPANVERAVSTLRPLENSGQVSKSWHRRCPREAVAVANLVTGVTGRLARANVGVVTGGLGSGGFVGRSREVGVLRDLVAAVAQGRGGVAWVEGEPGIGKSALVAEGLAEAAGLGCAVVTAS